MKTRSYGIALLPVVVALVAGTVLSTLHPGSARAANCIPNVDGFGHSAVLVNPVTFSGTLNATGCDFGIYVAPGAVSTITNATIVGPTLDDIAVNGNANISHSTLQSPSVAIYVGPSQQAAHAMISDNRILYSGNQQEGGILINHAFSSATITHNVIMCTAYLSVCGDGIGALSGNPSTIEDNTTIHNHIGIYFEANNGSDKVIGNLLKDNEWGIVEANGIGSVIEANRVEVGPDGNAIGIWDIMGTNDQIVKNFICAYATPINTQMAINPTVAGNVIQASCP